MTKHSSKLLRAVRSIHVQFWRRLLLFLLLPVALVLWTPLSWLVVVDARDHTVVWARPVRQGEAFYLRYTHSVTRRQVEDTYVIKGARLALTATRFEAVGAGLGYMGEGLERAENGWTVIEGMERQMPYLPLRVGAVADHRLVVRGREYHLWDYAPPYSLVYLEPRLASLGAWVYWQASAMAGNRALTRN